MRLSSVKLSKVCRALVTSVLAVSFPLFARGQDDARALAEAARLNDQVIELYEAGNYSAAIPVAERVLQIRQKHLPPFDDQIGESLNNLVLLQMNVGRYDKAEPMALLALEIRKRNDAAEGPRYAQSLNVLAGLYKLTGRYREAERLFLESMNIRKKVFGEEHADYANSLNNLATLYQGTGRLDEAERLYIKALGIRKKILGEQHPDYANTLNNLATLYRGMGRLDKAEELFLEATVVRKEALGPEHPNYAASLNNLANLYLTTHRYEEARRLYERATEIFRKVYGESHPHYATGLNNLALVNETLGRLGNAEQLYRRALIMRRRALGMRHPEYADSLGTLAGLYQSTGRYRAAEALQRRALGIRRSALGKNHPNVGLSFDQLASLCQATGRTTQALDFISRSLAIEQENIRHIFAASSESGMEDYLYSIGGPFDRLMSIAVSGGTHTTRAVETALLWTLRRKALVLDTLVRLRRSQVIAEKEPAVSQKVARLRYINQRLSNLPLDVSKVKNEVALDEEMDGLRGEQDRLEADLNFLLSRVAPEQESSEVSIGHVRQQLARDAALVEFVRYHVYNFKARGNEPRWKPERYCAFVLLPSATASPRLIDLGSADSIDNAIAGLRKHVEEFSRQWVANSSLLNEQTMEAAFRKLSAELYRLVFARIRKELGTARIVCLAPDNQLNLIPFDTLVDERGEYLVQSYQFAYLTTARDLLRRVVATGQGVVIFADPDYDMPAAKRAAAVQELLAELQQAASTQTGDAEPARAAMSAHPGRLSYNTQKRWTRGGLRWERLRSSAQEASDVAEQFRTHAEFYPINVYSEQRALEEAFKAVRGPRVLHVSAHGFFEADEKAVPIDDPAEINPVNAAVVGQALLRRAESPLLRSGIVLTGANNFGTDLPEGSIDDGWVTAEEISMMNLQGTELVVLSSCESGRGVVETGEGVYGLRRAFQHAGARSLVSALFDVPDTETQQFMLSFYRSFQSGKSKLKALHDAELSMMAERRKQIGSAHPFFWASFIFSGLPE
jgi:CHAT domain-containing protein/Tfp pilus assembly protein PilF